MSSAFFNVIREYHDLNFSLIWLYPKSKRPIQLGWTRNPNQSFDDLKATYHKDYNVGVRLGSHSSFPDGTYLAVIDCDVKSEHPDHLNEMKKVLDNLDLETNWLAAPKVMSGRGNGSMHIYVRTSASEKPFRIAKSNHLVKVKMPSVETFSNKEKEILTEAERAQGFHLRPAWEISFMTTGQQVVLPPSVHPDSLKQYEWIIPIKSIADIPIISIAKINTAETVLSGPVKTIQDFTPVPVNLIEAKIPNWVYELITKAEHLDRFNEDKSAAFFTCALNLVSAGLSDQEILTILTDPENEISQVPYAHTKSKSRQKAAQWVYKYNILKIKAQRSAELVFSDEASIENKTLSDSDAKLQESELFESWKDRLDRNAGNGLLKPTINNLVQIFRHVSDKVIFGFDEFHQNEIYLSNPPWAASDENYIGRVTTDLDISKIKYWFSLHYRLEVSENNILHAMSVVASENKNHPVRRYLKSISWDGKPRINTWLKEYMNAEGDAEYLKDVGRKLLCACVARVFEPGVKWDYVVIFEGKQGIGKSTACHILAKPWFTDSLGDINSKDVVDAMRGKWIVEIGELAVMRKQEVENLKHFITVQEDNVRKAYARKAQIYPRQCVFIGTTNRSDYLQDETGNRRFWPVKVGQVDFTRLIRDRDQLWAEAFEAWMEGEKLYLERENIRVIAEQEQAERFDDDEWTDLISETIETKEFLAKSGFTTIELWKQMNTGTAADALSCTQQIQKRIAKILRRLGYVSKITRTPLNAVRRQWIKL